MSESREASAEEAKARGDAFYVKMAETPHIGSAEALRAEQQLLERYKARGPRAGTLKPLAIFYGRVGQQERAYQYLKLWMKHARGQDELAECLLMSGQLAEQVDQPEPAAAFYREALSQKGQDPRVNYYLHNNLAYCLNQQGQFVEAVQHCQAAIALDPSRANAFKNFGSCLQGLGRWADAAQAWIKAVHVDVSDRRALELLEKLIPRHDEKIRETIPDIDQQLEACRRAYERAGTGRFSDWARGLTLN